MASPFVKNENYTYTFFLYNTIHPVYQNIPIKCICSFLKENLNMFLFGLCGKCKSSSIYCFIHSVNTQHFYLPMHWVYKTLSLPSLNLNLSEIPKGPHWYLAEHLDIFVQFSSFWEICWKCFLKFIINIGGGKWQKQDLSFMKEEITIKAIHW